MLLACILRGGSCRWSESIRAHYKSVACLRRLKMQLQAISGHLIRVSGHQHLLLSMQQKVQIQNDVSHGAA